MRATTEVEFSGNLSSGSGLAVGEAFTKTQRIYDSMGTPHNLVFKFTRLANGPNQDNQIQYSTEINVDGGIVKRAGGGGVAIDNTNPMIMTFNQQGKLNLMDYGQPTESAQSPHLSVEWNGGNGAAPLQINLKLGKGLGRTSSGGGVTPDPTAEGNLTAFDGPSSITYGQQDGLGYGRFETVRIEEDGIVSALFSNGRSVAIAKLAIGTVASPNDLDFATGNLYYETRKSGSIILGEAGQNGLGKIQSGALESSTVSLDQEFGKIMELKIYHQGCLMSMKQADRMSEELIQVMK